jgi:hypothetical protein
MYEEIIEHGVLFGFIKIMYKHSNLQLEDLKGRTICRL